jgi:hypothetical protein
MCDCSGLSGRVDILEAQYLSFPTNSDWSVLSSSNSARYNNLNSIVSSLQNKVTTLEQYIVNLKLAHTALDRAFTGHTGVPASTGHAGL